MGVPSFVVISKGIRFRVLVMQKVMTPGSTITLDTAKITINSTKAKAMPILGLLYSDGRIE